MNRSRLASTSICLTRIVTACEPDSRDSVTN